MFRERTRCFRRLLVGLTAAALLLSLPATGLAAERENRSGELASAGLLQRGAGYGTEAGSKAVRQIQLRLRRLGDRPGPIDGLYGPMTEAAVERFQRSHGLAIDGVVGPQTKGRLVAQRAEQPSTRSHRPAQTGKPERKSPARDQRAESAREQPPVRPSAGVGLGRPDPESSSGLPPLLVALGAGLVVASLLMSLRARRREAIEARLNLGLVFAALLAAGVLGAAVGALFATQAAPDDSDRTTADSGALLASRTGPAEPTAPTSPKTRPAATPGLRSRVDAPPPRGGLVPSGRGPVPAPLPPPEPRPPCRRPRPRLPPLRPIPAPRHPAPARPRRPPPPQVQPPSRRLQRPRPACPRRLRPPCPSNAPPTAGAQMALRIRCVQATRSGRLPGASSPPTAPTTTLRARSRTSRRSTSTSASGRAIPT